MSSATPLEIKRGRSSKWLYLVLPANIAWGPIATLITLYILNLGGTVIDVSYAITLGNAISIPAAFFWGKISDLYNRRKAQILISFIGLAAGLLGIYLSKSIIGATLIYGFLNFAYTANSAPLNLLVMEHSPRRKWAETFSRMQMMTSAGSTIGFVVAAGVTSFLHLGELLIVLLLVSLISVILTAQFLYEPAIRITRRLLLREPFAILSQTLIHPLTMVTLPGPSTLKRLAGIGGKGGWTGGHRYVIMLYVAAFVFYLGTSMFNTSYPAGLHDSGLRSSYIFIVLLGGILLQTATFNYSGWFLGRKSRNGLVVQSLALRGVSYVVIGITFFALAGSLIEAGTAFVVINIVFYALAAGFAYAIYYTLSNTIFFESIGSLDRGSALGIYAAVTGGGSLIGAFLSGYTSYYIGYWVAFALGGVLIIASAYVFARLPYGDGGDRT